MDKKILRACQYIDEHRDEMIDLWGRLVRVESGSANKKGVDEVARLVGEALAASGARVETVEMEKKGNSVKAFFHEEGKGEPILLLGHMDTVFAEGTLEKMPFRIDEDGRAYGPGVLDMKGGPVIVAFMLRALKEAGYEGRPIRVLFSGDEEDGHRFSTGEAEIREFSKGCAAAFNFETGRMDNGLVTGRMGAYRVQIEVQGVAAHCGNHPDRGRNAILEMAHKVIEIQKLHDFENKLYVNVGTIQGGTVPNAVPDKCEIVVDIRFLDKPAIEGVLQKIFAITDKVFVEGTHAKATVIQRSEPMPMNEKNLALFEHVRKAAEMTGCGEVHPKLVGGWSDSCLVAENGVPVICAMGVQGENNHSMQEYAVVGTMFTRAKLALASVMTL